MYVFKQQRIIILINTKDSSDTEGYKSQIKEFRGTKNVRQRGFERAMHLPDARPVINIHRNSLT